MPTVTQERLLSLARSESEKRASAGKRGFVVESRLRTASMVEFDVFLSHSYKDKQYIEGVCMLLERHGYSVYVDWIQDPEMDRSKITAATASQLRKRMRQAKCLFFATSENSSSSKWMPWECGFMDAAKNKVAIFPMTSTPINDYRGQEYLGLYPYISEDDDTSGRSALWVNESPSRYVRFDAWLLGKKPYKQP